MAIQKYIKNHPITYKCFTGSFVVTFIISTVLWSLVILDIEAKYFGDMLMEQNALKWVWLFASISILFITIKIYLTGPIQAYDDLYTKWLGIYSANTALSLATAYVALMSSAFIPIAIFDQSLPLGMTYFKVLTACAYCLFLTISLYAFYLALLVDPTLEKPYERLKSNKILRLVLLGFVIFFLIGRVGDVIKIFKPELV